MVTRSSHSSDVDFDMDALDDDDDDDDEDDDMFTSSTSGAKRTVRLRAGPFLRPSSALLEALIIFLDIFRLAPTIGMFGRIPPSGTRNAADE